MRPSVQHVANLLRKKYIENTGIERFIYRGRSMNPLFVDGDVLTVKHCSFSCLCFADVIVYRKIENYIVHRFLYSCTASDGRFYVVAKGDNSFSKDLPVLADLVIGKVVALQRGGKLIKLENVFLKIWLFLLGGISLCQTVLWDGLINIKLKFFNRYKIHPCFRNWVQLVLDFPRRIISRLIFGVVSC